MLDSISHIDPLFIHFWLTYHRQMCIGCVYALNGYNCFLVKHGSSVAIQHVLMPYVGFLASNFQFTSSLNK